MGAKNVVYSRNKHFSSACVPEDDSVVEEAKRDEDRACEDDKGRRLKPETRTTKSNKTTHNVLNCSIINSRGRVGG